jgi:rare lipoprotein A
MAPNSPHWRSAFGTLLLALLALLGACGSTPRPAAPGGIFDGGRDGPPSDPPADLIDRPDAEPRIEPIRGGGPNKPYEVLGQRYTPLTTDEPVDETGLASWYGRKFHGRPTASGEVYDMYAMSAAHRTMPLPSYARIRNPANGREVVVRVNDRGPFESTRIVDLSYAAAMKLGVLRGVTPVEVRRLTNEDIRTGRWRADGASAVAAAPAASATTPPQVPTAAATLVAAAPADAAAAGTASAVVVDAPAPAQPSASRGASAAPGYWVQLGAFRQPQGAFELRRMLTRELAWLEPWLAIFEDDMLFRLQAGPYASRTEAQGTAERIRGSSVTQPMVVQRR